MFPTTAKFNVHSQAEFVRTLKLRVNDYLQQKHLTRFGDGRLYWKSFFMLALYLVPFTLLLLQVLPFWANWLLYLCMSFGVVGIGMSVMHDAVHGSFSSRPWINQLFAYTMEMLGGNSFNWKVQHNVLHHTYTNIPGMDEDIANRPILRLNPEGKWNSAHQYQHWYAFPLYCMLTLSWIFWGDFSRVMRYNRMGLTAQVGHDGRTELIKLIFFKIAYLFLNLVLPIFILGLVWWQVLLGFLMMHFIAGFILSVVFQLAHVVEETSYVLPDEHGNLENSSAVHQLCTTANFAKRNRIFSWFIGGLNYQIEHHLFPYISHVHYPKISEIVKQTAQEFHLPYFEYDTFGQALVSHWKQLRALGQQPVPALS
jgi:linoleoyl-CoA desaturase